MTSLAEVEQLVQRLYSSSDPAVVNGTQSQLQATQRENGWQIAEALLQSDDQNVRFFGALTWLVKINQDGASLGEDDLTQLQATLLNWTVRLASGGESTLVLRKLCSVLVAFFMLAKVDWRLCIRHIIVCFRHGQVFDTETAVTMYPSEHPLADLWVSLSSKQKDFVLAFTTSLAEDAARVEHGNQHFDYCHERVALNLPDAIEVMQYCFQEVNVQSNDSLQETLKCYQAWTTYTRQEQHIQAEQMGQLQQLNSFVVQQLGFDEHFETISQFLIENFSSGESFLSPQQSLEFSQILGSPWAKQWLEKLEDSDPEHEAILFGQLVCSFGHTSAKLILRGPSHYSHIMTMVHSITRTQTFYNHDHTLSSIVIDYWEIVTSYAETIDEVDGGFRLIGAEWLAAIEELCFAGILPIDTSTGDLQNLAQDNDFSAFRFRIKDAIAESFVTFGVVILQKLTNLAMSCHAQRGSPEAWPSVESIFNCLSGLAETMRYEVGNEEVEDVCLHQLFSSQMYSQLTDLSFAVPMKLRKKAMTIIGEHDAFLARHPDLMLGAIQMLFQCLERPELTHVASRSILTLCDPNRNLLHTLLPAFIEAVERVYTAGNADDITKENLVGALAAIIQATPLEEDRVRNTVDLLNMLMRDLSNGLGDGESTQSVDPETQHIVKLATLSQLLAVAKASQTPDEAIDLDADDEILTDTPWNGVQATAKAILDVILEQPGLDGELFQAVCDVTKAGFKERASGPFVFTPESVVDILTGASHRWKVPRIDIAIRTSATFISSNNSKLTRLAASLPALITWITNDIPTSLHITSGNPLDPDILHALIDFTSRLVPSHLSYLAPMPQPNLHWLFTLTITALLSADVLPKRAAAGLWTDLLSLPSTSRSAPLVSHLLHTHGLHLTTALIFNFGGLASRSQLDWLIEPYRKLIAKSMKNPQGGNWKVWTQQALDDAAFPGQATVRVEERVRFVRQLEMLRGDSRCRETVRNFWVLARGTPLAYGS